MNPSYGIVLWIVIGGLAGWGASALMGTNRQQGLVANIVIGVVGAVLGGFVTSRVFGDWLGNNGLLASFGVALLGSVIVIAIWQVLSGGRGRLAS